MTKYVVLGEHLLEIKVFPICKYVGGDCEAQFVVEDRTFCRESAMGGFVACPLFEEDDDYRS